MHDHRARVLILLLSVLAFYFFFVSTKYGVRSGFEVTLLTCCPPFSAH
ncbi:MAG: hypothetical protein PWQ40_2219, partial [Archaeoglobus sp.]|nr:hypothetical protein [Archaeoglobus sp.]